MVARDVPLAAGAVVTFRAPGGHRPATLLQFPRSRVTLARLSGGRLVLQAGRRYSLARIRARRASRVLVRLDVAGSRITARAGRGRLRIERRLSSETRIMLARRLRGVSVKPLEAPHRMPPTGGASPVPTTVPPADTAPVGVVPPGAPTEPPAPSPTPTASGPAVAARLFAPDSVWNRPLAANAELDPASATLVGTLRAAVAKSDAWITAKGTSPLYTVPADQPTVRVALDNNTQWWRKSLQQAFEAVPIPDGAVPSAISDAHMTIWQPATDRLWEFFHARKLADGWHASWGGAIEHVSRSPGYYDEDSWPGLSAPNWGATATSLPVIAGTMMLNELQAGTIPHALALNIPWAKPNVYAWPAQRSDGRSTDPNAIPEGARFRLDPRLDLDKLNLPPLTLTIAKAAQRYGMIVRDQTGQAVSLFAENTTQYGTNPYPGLFGGKQPNILLRTFPWQHLQLLKMQLHTVR